MLILAQLKLIFNGKMINKKRAFSCGLTSMSSKVSMIASSINLAQSRYVLNGKMIYEKVFSFELTNISSKVSVTSI